MQNINVPAATTSVVPTTVAVPRMTDLTTVRNGIMAQRRLPPQLRYYSGRQIRRKPGKAHESKPILSVSALPWAERRLRSKRMNVESEFTYITGPKYFFQRFVRKHPTGAAAVWVFLFLVELAMVVLYILQASIDEGRSWDLYATKEYSGWFYAFFSLSVVSLLQLLFAYSLGVWTILVVVCTSVYQIAIFFVSLSHRYSWVSRMNVPFFLRVWPMRQYFLFVLDSVALMMPHNSRLDLVRLAAGPLTRFVALVFTAAGCFRLEQVIRGYPVNVGVSIYYIVTTVTTVGFGDVVPRTEVSKLITIVIILIFISQMPTFIQVMRSTAKILKLFRPYSGRLKHFIVYGRVTRAEAIAILDEVFRLYPMKSVCFCNSDFPRDVLAIQRHPTYRLRSTFLTIDTLDSQAMYRLKAHKASAVIILPSEEGNSARVDDNVMLVAAVFERMQPMLPQYVWLRYGLHAKLLQGHSVAVIEENTKKNITACALLMPGIIPFLVNLVRTASAPKVEKSDEPAHERMSDWRRAYEHSRRQVISASPVPASFVGATLRDVITAFHRRNILVVGVQESARQVMQLDLDYTVDAADLLMTIYEGGRNVLEHALDDFATLGSVNEVLDDDAATCDPAGGAGLVRAAVTADDFPSQNINLFVSDPCFHHAGQIDECDTTPHTTQSCGSDGNAEWEVKRRLLELDLVRPTLTAPQLDRLHFSIADVNRLRYLVDNFGDTTASASFTEDERADQLRHLQCQIREILSLTALQRSQQEEGRQQDTAAHPDQDLISVLSDTMHETFLFVDQTASIRRHVDMSVYEDIISQTIAQYQLYVMMKCLRSLHPCCQLTLLTLRQHSEQFLQTWVTIFGSPLNYIRGQGSVDAHLNYALNADTQVARTRGILLYCSQMGPRDFGDVPIFSVENSTHELLKWHGARAAQSNADQEQHIIIELQSFTSSVQIPPFHRDPLWRQRGAENFQYSLSFMMGRSFSSNMLLPLMIHSHRNYYIARFFEMVLNLSSTADMFEMAEWTSRGSSRKALFCFWVCSHRDVMSFGAAFDFLLLQRGCVCIGIFRAFPFGYTQGSSRYFITNPPRETYVVGNDILYCLDPSVHNARP